MPTGYTCDVQDGKITEFKDFALRCARAMGANILMRDDPSDAPIKEYEPSTFYKDRLEESERRLAEIRNMTDEQCEQQASDEYLDLMGRYLESISIRKEKLRRYQSMLNKVRQWEPPTPDHEGFKNFMVEQLTESINHDCDTSYLESPIKQTGTQWRFNQIRYLEKDIPQCRESYQEEVESTNDRNEWNRKLIESLNGQESVC